MIGEISGIWPARYGGVCKIPVVTRAGNKAARAIFEVNRMDADLKREYLALRKAILEKEYVFLNDRQRSAVFAANGPLLVLAGAGSGKTTALINRIAYLIRYGNAYESDSAPGFIDRDNIDELRAYLDGSAPCRPERLAFLLADKPVKPWRILAITFTNKAAGEIKDRLKRVLAAEADGIWAATFHSACVRILRRDCERIGYKPGFTIYDADDTLRVIKDVMSALGLDVKEYVHRAVAEAISGAKDKLLTPDEFMKRSAGDDRLMTVAKIYKLYQSRLAEANAFDFDDLIMQTVHLLRTSEEARNFYTEKFSHILVDEYQDVNHAQNVLVSILSRPRCNICVVGDDDQSIYGFRGATVDNILNFEKEFDNARVIKLEQNYRSTSYILDAANAVIKNNVRRKGKMLWTDRGQGSKIVVYEAEDEQSEGAFVADTVLKNVAKGIPWAAHTVLYRMNAQSNMIEQALRYRSIPYRIIGGLRFYDRAEIKDMMAYLQVISNPADTLRLSRIVNTPARKIGEKTFSAVLETAEKLGVTPFEVMLNLEGIEALEKPAPALKRFAKMIFELIELSKLLPLDELYEELLEKSGYRDWLIMKPSDENRARLENIMELKTNIIYYMRASDTPSLQGFLEETALLTDIDRYDENADAVTLMTIHSAKGLEFPVTFIVGMEDGVFPTQRSVEAPGGIEEERRLAYVGMTRAKNELYMTYTRHRTLFGKTSHNTASMFLAELPGKCIEVRAQRPVKAYFADGIPGGPAEKIKPAAASWKSTDLLPNISASKIKPQKPGIRFKVGDLVEHSVFGSGIVISRMDTSGDSLLEIEFDNHGKKRMMENYTRQFLTLKKQ